MKTIFWLTLLCAFVFSTPIFAQDIKNECEKKPLLLTRHEVGLFIGANKDISAAYRFKIPKKSILRVNLNTKLNAAFIDTSVTNFLVVLNLSAGYERHLTIGDKWNVYFGGETNFATNIYNFSLNNSVITASGLTGIRCQIKPQVGFFAESKFGIDTLLFINQMGFNSRLRPSSEINLGVLYTIGRTT